VQHIHVMSWVESAYRGAIDVLLGVRCLGCGSSGSAWCFACVHDASAPRTRSDGRVRINAAARYRGEVATAINAHKERGHLTLSEPLGLLLAAAVLGHVGPGDPVRIVPCPSSRQAVKLRGQDHAHRLASSAARWIHRAGTSHHPHAVVLPLLHQRQGVRDQVGLSPSERLVNMRDALTSISDGAGQRVIIVDDITTSGATLRAAAEALETAGWSVLGAAVVADAHA